MNKIQDLKKLTDLRQMVAEDLGPSPCRGGQALLWRCPFHNERHGYSLAIWVDGWRCFGSCQMSGDVLDWLERYRGLTFAEAYEALGAEPQRSIAHKARCQRSEVWSLRESSPPDASWQQAAWEVVLSAAARLWSSEGKRALYYLRQRGLQDATIREAQLGYIPGKDWRRIQGLKVAPGIVIPWQVDGTLWAVKIRRAAGLPKYVQVAGSSAGGLYNAHRLRSHATALFVEGEFDALLAHQEVGDLVGVVTLGSASNRLSERWLAELFHCQRLLVAYDNDEAGRKGAERLQALTKRTHVVQVPFGKDITEFVLKGGNVKDWIEEFLR